MLKEPKIEQNIHTRGLDKILNDGRKKIFSHIGLSLGNLSITPVVCTWPASGWQEKLITIFAQHLTLRWLPNRALTGHDNA